MEQLPQCHGTHRFGEDAVHTTLLTLFHNIFKMFNLEIPNLGVLQLRTRK